MSDVEEEGRWVPVPPAHLGDDLDEWVESCPSDRVVLLGNDPSDLEARHYVWEWVPFDDQDDPWVQDWPKVVNRRRGI